MIRFNFESDVDNSFIPLSLKLLSVKSKFNLVMRFNFERDVDNSFTPNTRILLVG